MEEEEGNPKAEDTEKYQEWKGRRDPVRGKKERTFAFISVSLSWLSTLTSVLKWTASFLIQYLCVCCGMVVVDG